jgi:hypothetical protein
MPIKPLFFLPVLASSAVLMGCNPQPSGNEAATIAAATPDGTEAPVDAASTDVSPMQGGFLDMAETAWRVTGEDGAIYTSFLDPDGAYRDFKNGDLWQTGQWKRVGDGRLCFTPDDEERSGECWTNDPPVDGGTMRTTSDTGRTVELRQVAYIAPAEV